MKQYEEPFLEGYIAGIKESIKTVKTKRKFENIKEFQKYLVKKLTEKKNV